MRIQVTLDSDAGSLTIHAEGCTAATPPARLAATLASIVEATLNEPAAELAMSAQPSPADQPPAADQPADPTADTVRSVAPVADSQPAPPRSAAEAPSVPPVVQPTVTEPAVSDLAAEMVTEVAEVVVAIDVPPEGGEQDGSLRRAALQLLDDGRTDDQVCAQLGISRSRLLRWDDPDGQFLPPLASSLTAVSA